MDLTAAARLLRRTATKNEIALWRHLKGHQMGGIKFRRQHKIEPFVVDFCAPSIKLIIEIDGPTHDDRLKQDADRAREEKLRAQGYSIVRFSDDYARQKMPEVLDELRRIIGKHLERD